MKVENRTVLKFDEDDNVRYDLKQSAALGELFDSACKFKAFIAQKILENQSKEEEQEKPKLECEQQECCEEEKNDVLPQVDS